MLFRLRTLAWLLMGAVVAGCSAFLNGPGGLGLGKEAPAIEGTDADGRPLRLSDYRGKVVLLEFWKVG